MADTSGDAAVPHDNPASAQAQSTKSLSPIVSNPRLPDRGANGMPDPNSIETPLNPYRYIFDVVIARKSL